MTGFSAGWLDLREPYDARARNLEVLNAVAAFLRPRPSVRVVDLGCGTGSNLRALSPRLPAGQTWNLIDKDAGLLSRAAAAPLAKDIEVTVIQLDLNYLETALEGPIDLVTTSALLDLVSAAWVDRLAVALAARSIPFYAALSYDGRTGLTPHDSSDATIIAAVNAHQHTDKGFGPALGPTAASFTIARFEALGYSVVQGASDWVMGPDDRKIQTEILIGWASASHEIANNSEMVNNAADWLRRRRAAIDDGRSSLRVGHVDLFAIPSATR
jgi:SAM-dependent methyltransferase